MMAKDRFEEGGAMEPEEGVPIAEVNRLSLGQARIEIEIDCGDCPFTAAEAYQLERRIRGVILDHSMEIRKFVIQGNKGAV